MKFLLLLICISVITDARRFKCNKQVSCGCGYSNVEIDARLINGEVAIQDSWSMVVSIRYDFLHTGNSLQHACGGTILTDSYILTAATCLEQIQGDVKLANLTVVVGIYRISESSPVTVEVDEIIFHPSRTNSLNNFHHDIALLHLSEPLHMEWNPFITRACLPAQLNNPEKLIHYPATNATLVVVGWGRTSFHGQDSNIFRQVAVSSIDQTDPMCTNIINDVMTQFCAGLRETSSGPCFGDFGGPIFQWLTDHWEQVGIASFTSDNCDTKLAAVYTRIAYYRDWIDRYIKKNDEITEEPPIIITIKPTETTESPYVTYQCDKTTVPCGCGRRNVRFPTSNNISRHEAIPHSWSMIVSIRLNNIKKHSCTGSIIDESYILTSASCIANAATLGITIAAGIHNHSDDEALQRKVDRIFLHPYYKGASDNFANDIAILHISETLDIANDVMISRICVPEKDPSFPNPFYYPAPGTQLAVIGWGSMNCQDRTDQHLVQQFQVYSVNNEGKNCYVLNQHQNIQFCAGIDSGETVPCVGDAGSPIFEWIEENRWQQVGIASFVIDHVNFRNLGIYTRLVEYKDWIQTIINNCSTIVTSPPSTITTTTISTTTKSVKPSVFYECNRTSTCGCGRVPVVLTPTRIVGGEPALDYSWPMIVSMRWGNNERHICGGSILSNSFILTAAHCFSGAAPNPPIDLIIAVGMTNLLDPKQIRRTVDHVYIHAGYNHGDDSFRHDIAVMHLNQSLQTEINLSVTKTCIHRVNPPVLSNQYIKNGTSLAVIGWGDLRESSWMGSQILQQVEVYAIDNNDPICVRAMNDSELQFCAGLEEGGKDSCQGDSGGPIFQWTGQYWEQVGVVSNGQGCARPGYPGVYTRLSYYYDWINDILKNGTENLEPKDSSNGTSITTTTSTIRAALNNSTTTNDTTRDPRNNGCSYQENVFTPVLLILLFSMLLQ